jgi:hypothetical protein
MPFAPAAALPAERAPRHRASWVFGTIVVLFLLAPAAFTAPRQVNAVAYLAGAGRPDTFTGYSYGRECRGSSCTTTTEGTLASTGQAITWPGAVPLGQGVPVRDPVWNLQSPRLAEGVPDALVGVALGLFFDTIALLALAACARRLIARIRAGRPAPGGYRSGEMGSGRRTWIR